VSLPALRPLKSLQRLRQHLPRFSNPFTMLWYMLQHQPVDYAGRTPPIVGMPTRDYSFKDMSFTFAVIGLCARLASLESTVTKSQYVAFREAFPIEPGICEKLRALFGMACADQTPFTQYVRHITIAYPRRMSLFTALLDRLFRIACADGELSKPREQMLAKISHMLGISPADYSALRARALGRVKPHEVLGVAKSARSTELKRRYHELMRRYHPDRYSGETLSSEVELMLQLKISEINDAYGRLARKAA
jgi:DnaJ like chaperone protein